MAVSPVIGSWVLRDKRNIDAFGEKPKETTASHRGRVAAAVVVAAVTAACGSDPGAPLISLPERSRPPVDPATVAATTPDGFPNVLVDPATFDPDRRTSAEIAAAETELAGRAAGVDAAAVAAAASPSQLEALRRRAATHAAEAERAIETTGRVNRP